MTSVQIYVICLPFRREASLTGVAPRRRACPACPERSRGELTCGEQSVVSEVEILQVRPDGVWQL
ncbi:MAG TPA: hypothetical protein VIK28_07800 [Sedimentisphaerales bacterium]